MTSIIIIGAGIGGIASAAHLARRGYQVTVVEKNEVPGGRCGQFIKDGHQFDIGATLFLIPQLYEQAFAKLGERIEDHLDLQRVDPTYRLYFRDGASLDLSSDLHCMQAQLEAIEPGSFAAYLRYLEESGRHYEQALPKMVGRGFYSLFEFINPANLLLFMRIKALHNHYRNTGRFFNDPRLRVAFSFQNLYMGLSPFSSPATYSFLQYTEAVHGIWYPMGGMHAIIHALVNIAQKWGVKFFYNAPVEQINISGNCVTGVTLSNGQNGSKPPEEGRKLKADIVIANADLSYVYRELLPADRASSKIARRRQGCSALVFYWGLDKRFPQLRPHSLFIAHDYRQSFKGIFDEFGLPEDPSFYVHAPVGIDPSMAPPDGDTLMIAFPVGRINVERPQDWGAIKDRARIVALDRLTQAGVHKVKEHTKFEVCYTPRYWLNRFNLTMGSSHGLNHHLLQMGYFRPANRHHRYKNLYFTGASTHPGTGLPSVLVSADLVSQRIIHENGVHR